MVNKRNNLKLIILLAISVVAAVYIFFNPFYSAPKNEKYVSFCEDDQCHNTNLPYQNPALSIDVRVDDLISRMTVAEKIGQMALIEKKSITDFDDIARYGLGALVSGGGGKPVENTPAGWLEMINNFQKYSQKTRLGIPLLYGADANHGNSNIPGATIFPHSIGLGASNDSDLVRNVARATAEEVMASGINWIYSPNLDVVQDTRWGRTYETFGSDTETVSVLGEAYINGLQSFSQSGLKLATAAKHYVGNGSAEWGSSINKDFFMDQGNTNISEENLRKNQLAPFKRAVDAKVNSIMVGLNKWNGSKISTNKYLLTDVLKKEFGFQGFLFSDWYGVYEKEWDKYRALVNSINAGLDMVMLPFDYKYFSDSMHRALANGDISQSRVDDAVRRILKVKFEIGLFDNTSTDSPDLKSIGSKQNRELAREAVRKSLVLLKNKKTVPLSKNISKILVSGSAADNIGKQSGGWTVEWQGIDGNWIPGTTILKGIQNTVSPRTKVEYDLKGNFADQKGMADVGIAVVGESPYAEGWGDNENPKLTEEDVQAIYNLKKISKKIVVIIVSGRPLDITQYTDDFDAIVAAWLPGTEGQGVADVLFGDYTFTGKLPIEWKME